jgi:carboxyl-terminal processing protease
LLNHLIAGFLQAIMSEIQTPLHMRNTKYFFPILLLSASLFFAGCKKDKESMVTTPPPTPPVVGGGGTVSSLPLKDSVLLVTKDIYLWNTQIPGDFNVQNYADPAGIMTAIRPFSMEPGFPSAVDKWSFAMKKTEWDEISGGMGLLSSTTGAGDFGFSVFFRVDGDLRVRLVEPNAPAGQAGIRRGWRITAINGNSNITTGNADFIVNAVYNATSSSFTFQKPDGSTVSLTLQASHYTEKPVYLDTVYSIAGKKIGYLVFNSFLGNVNSIRSEFQRVFNHFASEQVTEMVIDLRYNGGGYVSLAEQLGNYLVRSAANGSLMMTQLYNSQNSQYNEVTNFHKAGSLNLDDIYFIVGRSTASASELLINNLKPYMDVKLIGASATHGKPVGFFPIPLGEWYIFPVSFKTINKNGEGNYYNGIPVNASIADGLDKDWGDPMEASLASALRNIVTGSYRTNNNEPVYKQSPSVSLGNEKLDASALKIAIGNRRGF